jgi:hypothetical protein
MGIAISTALIADMTMIVVVDDDDDDVAIDTGTVPMKKDILLEG